MRFLEQLCNGCLSQIDRVDAIDPLVQVSDLLAWQDGRLAVDFIWLSCRHCSVAIVACDRVVRHEHDFHVKEGDGQRFMIQHVRPKHLMKMSRRKDFGTIGATIEEMFEDTTE